MAYRFLEDQPKESTIRDEVGQLQKGLVRQSARTASNLGTRALGLPGDVLSLINEYAARPAARALGLEDVPYEKTLIGKAIPTTETHRKGLEQVTGDYLKPQNKVEQFVDDVLEDTAFLFVPGGAQAKAGQQVSKASKMARNFSKALGANLVGESVGQATGSETAGDLTKAGALFTASILDFPRLSKQLSNLYKTAEASLPEGAAISAGKLDKRLSDLEKTVTAGRPRSTLSPSKTFVMDKIDKVKSLIKDEHVDIKQLWDQKRDLNEELAKLYEIPGKANQKSARNMSKLVTKAINDTIEDYGKTNPAFYKPFKDADQAYGILAKSNMASKWAKNAIKFSPTTPALLNLLGLESLKTVATGSALVSLPAYHATKLMYKIAKSPTLSKMYRNMVKSAVKEDAVLFNKYAQNLDESLQQEEAKARYRFVD